MVQTEGNVHCNTQKLHVKICILLKTTTLHSIVFDRLQVTESATNSGKVMMELQLVHGYDTFTGYISISMSCKTTYKLTLMKE